MAHNQSSTKSPSIIVKPPEQEQIEQFARNVCHEMKQRHDIHCDPFAIRSLTEFMTIACRVTAKIKQEEINNGKKYP